MHWLRLDLASNASVRGCVHAFLVAFRNLHLLVNAAGIMAVPWALTEDGNERQWAVNFLGHFLLTGAPPPPPPPWSARRESLTRHAPAPAPPQGC